MAGFPKGFPRRGEIYWASLPSGSGSAQTGHRPVLIVSNDTLNQHSPVVVVAALTRTVRAKRYPQNVHLPAGQPLPDEGTVLCNQLYTLDKADLGNHLAGLDRPQRIAVSRALALVLGLLKLKR